jgi:hypothetical protein
MAKAILEFDMNDKDDRMAHLRAVKSTDMASFIFELVSNEKKSIMYQLDNRDMKDWEAVDLVFDRIHNLLQEFSIDIDELIT